MTIGEQIRHVRRHVGLTQKELGRLSGTSETTIKQYELGKRQPRLEQLQKIANALGGTISEIFLFENDTIDTGDLFGGLLPDEIGSYIQEIGEFLYSNPGHKPLFDSVMEVQQIDIDLVRHMLDRINGKINNTEE